MHEKSAQTDQSKEMLVSIMKGLKHLNTVDLPSYLCDSSDSSGSNDRSDSSDISASSDISDISDSKDSCDSSDNSDQKLYHNLKFHKKTIVTKKNTQK